MKPTSHTLATPLLAASFVQAFPGMTLGNHIGAVDNADWADLLARANATSTIAVPFYDVSKNYSSRAQPSLDWEAKLSVVAGVPVLGSDDEFFTLTQIELTPPESLRNDNNTYRVEENQWQTCENWLFQVNDRTSEEIHPRCEGVLSKDCLESLQELSKLDNCINVLPDSCQGDSDNHLGASNQAPVVSNGTYGLGYESSDYKPEKAGATKSYDDAIQKVWVFWFGAGRQIEDENGNWDMENSKRPSTLSCIRAQNFTEGSRKLSRAGRIEVGVIGALVTAVTFGVICW